MEQNLVILNLESKYKELGIVNYVPGEPVDTLYKIIGRKIEVFKALQDLELQNAIYYDEWRDKWIIREELPND